MQFSTNLSNRVFIHLHSQWVGAKSIAHSFSSCRISSILFTSFLLGAISATAQNASNVERSPDAIALIQRVLDASGGSASIMAIHDLVATGTLSTSAITQDTENGSVTISLRGVDQLRIDSTLPVGARSLSYNRGMASTKEKDGTVIGLGPKDAVSNISHFFPLEHLAAALQDSSYYLTKPEIVAEKEISTNLYHFRLQQISFEVAGNARRRTSSSVPLDYYVDPTTNCVVRVENRSDPREPMGSDRGPSEIYRFSDYRMEHGFLFPHQVSVSLNKDTLYTIRISNYLLNTGLTQADFSPNGKP